MRVKILMGYGISPYIEILKLFPALCVSMINPNDFIPKPETKSVEIGTNVPRVGIALVKPAVATTLMTYLIQELTTAYKNGKKKTIHPVELLYSKFYLPTTTNFQKLYRYSCISLFLLVPSWCLFSRSQAQMTNCVIKLN
jgi:hypothetical protein